MSVERIAEIVESLPPEQALDTVIADKQKTRARLNSSVKAEDMVVLHLLRQRIPDVPVLFLDTGYHFSQTYEYRDRLAKEWSLHLVNVLPVRTVAEQESALGVLYQTDPTRCCPLRKVEALLCALEPYDIWFTGLRREQSPTRKSLKKVELHRLPTVKTLWKVSLLADSSWGQVWHYVNETGISHIPQYDEGDRSIGCQPCTTLPADSNNPRSGRWRGTKLECGIHTFSKRAGE